MSTSEKSESAEEWKPVPLGWGDLYEVSNKGRIRTIATGAIRKAGISRSGHHRAHLSRYSVNTGYAVHRLVLEAFQGPPPSIMHTDCAHLDGNPGNNNLENLQWATRKENSSHMVGHGTLRRGEGRPHILKTEQVLEMRQRRAAGATMRELFDSYPASTSVIRGIIQGKGWKHLPMFGLPVIGKDKETTQMISRTSRIRAMELEISDLQRENKYLKERLRSAPHRPETKTKEEE